MAMTASATLVERPAASTRVLGVDPGLGTTGYAVLERLGRSVRVLEAGVVRSGQSDKAALGPRLETLHRGILEVLEAYPVSALALEQVHSHAKFPRTSILMGHARGVIMLAAQQKGVPTVGYAATRIKKSLTGSGRAPKEQMQHAIRTELGLDRLPEPHDVADACAVALCYLHTARLREIGR